MKGRVATANFTNVALEVLNIHCIETNDGRVQSDISLRNAIAIVEGPSGGGEMFFGSIERFEQSRHSAFIGFLGAVIC